MNIKYSVIIPTLNEEDLIGGTISNVRNTLVDSEIIIVDGFSSDGTMEIAQKAGVKCLSVLRGRGQQMNFGALNAKGEILVFLHADTLLPDNAFELITDCFKDDNNKIAVFQLSFNNSNILMKLYSYLTKIKFVFTKFGDQVIIIRKQFFKEIGGFPDQMIFEDVEIFKKAEKSTKVRLLKGKVITSDRRFKKHGYIKTQLISGWLFFLYNWGVSPEKIYSMYYGETEDY